MSHSMWKKLSLYMCLQLQLRSCLSWVEMVLWDHTYVKKL
ncbi:unnamed protein product [Arabidopsis lyrata]|nr:unnamed protein product [Arabidopsis lyrata]